MNALSHRWDMLNVRYMALSRRERLLVALSLLLVPALLAKMLFADPQWARVRTLERSLATQGSALADLKIQLATLQRQLGSDPDADKKAELGTLTADRSKLDEQLLQAGSTLVRPEQMNGLLERLLARHSGLRLVSLKTLAPVSVLKPAAPSEGGKAAGKPEQRLFDLYRHDVEIRLEGSYAELQAYLEQLERTPQRLLWERVDYRVIDHPRAEMTLVVFTLSPERTWLAL